MRVAIVGQGPKGLFALGELLGRWPAGVPLRVDCFDPRPPGTGAAYHPDQPDFLRLNVTPRLLRMPGMPDFADWLQERGRHPDGDVPRALVGRYLAQAHAALLRQPAPGVVVEHHSLPVSALRRRQEGWEVLAGPASTLVDEVLLATGHADEHDGRLVHQWQSGQPTRLVERVYPVREWLDEGHVPPGSTVAVRGAALTFIDVVLALTEGRDRDRWPARILPLGRGGQLMAAKPTPGYQLATSQQEAVASAAEAMPRDPSGALARVRRLAVELLVHEQVDRGHASLAVAHAFRTGWDPDLDHAPRALHALERSLAQGACRAPMTASWALGRAWAGLYPAVVDAISLREPTAAAWQEFARAAAVLEKFTYGPLRPNAERLVWLCRLGAVDLSWLEHGVRVGATLERLPSGAPAPDVVVDAVNSPPGALGARHPVLDALVAEGHARTTPPRRGLSIAGDAQCLGRDGTRTPGLSALGRPVEDVVIGNDTLGRSLHHQVEDWAARLAASAPAPTAQEIR